ncbi:MAG: ATP-binding protein [Candidatus Aenigmarchaeota archaeon]|nr:ATP-binding protein [Candidatus Aenigmarchaeota archaeon]
MKTITILSGKGGVGKSSITSSLAMVAAAGRKITAADCDVDASNLALVLGLRDEDIKDWKWIETSEKAVLDTEKCIHCGKCRDVCKFSAVGWDEKKKMPVFSDLLCEGCGTCGLVCPSGAISLKRVKNARIGTGKTKYGFTVVTGQLKMGESGSGKVVMAVKDKAMEVAKKNGSEIMFVDSAAGIGCPVIASVNGSDYVIAVTEPTPSAMSDMERALKVADHFGILYGIVINKWDLNPAFSGKIEKFAKERGIPVLGKIPYDRKFVEALVNLRPVVTYGKKYEKIFSGILEKIRIIE